MAGLQKILLVEDNYQLQEIYTTTLGTAGFTVESAVDGDEALEKAKTFGADLIFLDVMIPGKSGVEVLKLLRSDAQYNSLKTKIVLLTNLSQDNQLGPGVQALTDGYVVKADIDPTDLIEVINSFKTD